MQKQDIKISYETLWKFIIRPPRDEYDEDLLVDPTFTYKNKTYQRKDYVLISSEGYKMRCSLVEPNDASRPSIIMPLVLYLHGNSSSRLEGLNNLQILLNSNINLFVIDFPGCGLSDGEFISLGYHESHDVKVIVDFIEKLPGVGKIGLWGRSMGAATTMIYTHTDDRIKAIVMDSPFADFNILAKELVLKQVKLPNFLIEGALKIVRMTIRKKNGLDIERLKPIDSAPKTMQPAIFVHANSDELINNKHSDMLYNAYGGKDKKLLKCVGNHNTKRSNKIIREIGEFFYKHLVLDDNVKDNEDDKNNIFYLDLNSDENKNNKQDDKNNINQNNNTDNSQKEKEKDKNETNLINNEKQETKEESKKDTQISNNKKDVNEIREENK